MTFNNYDLESLKWKVGEKVKKYDCPILTAYVSQREAKDGRVGDFINLECPDWIIVIPIINKEDGPYVLMELQYRHGTEAVTCEYPAGVVERGEDPLVAAKRELLEETGYVCSSIKELAAVCPNSAFMSNKQHIYLAEGLTKVQGQDLDQNEEIQVLLLKLDDVIASMGTGLFTNALMSTATFFLQKELASRL